MKTQGDIKLLIEIEKLKDKINTESEYQRPEVWTKAQKELLIDSILRKYDIPKIYLKEESPNSQYEYEVIDGQQRLVAIWEFFDGDFALPNDAEPVNYRGTDIDILSQDYHSLDVNLRKRFENYPIDIVVVSEAIQDEEKDEIGDLFLRLQGGTPLNEQEKRNAMPGKMKDFIKELATHKFFEHSFSGNNTRYAYDQLAAQLTLLEFSLESKKGRPTNIATRALDRMYKKHNKFDMHGETANKVRKTLDYLHRAFPNKTDELVNHSVVTLYCLTSKLLDNYDAVGTEKLLSKWFMEFEDERRKNDLLPSNEKNATLLEYRSAGSHGSDSQKSIEKRLNLLEERFFKAEPDIKKR